MGVQDFVKSRWYWGAWTLLGVFMTTQDLVAWNKTVTPGVLTGLLLLNLGQNLAWGVLSLATLQVTLRFPLHAHPPVRNWLAHVAASFLIVPVGMVLITTMAFLHSPPEGPLLEPFLRFALWYISFEYVVCYWGVVGLHEGFQILRQYRAEELEVSVLEAQLAEARLQSLKLQLNPHFLFNALNSLSALLNSRPDRADRMLVKLSHFLRISLSKPPEGLTPLHEELGLMEDFIDLERVRFDEDLQVSVEVPEACREALVPAFLLQPLLENAFKHGLSGRSAGGAIHLRARREPGALVLEVQDNGRGRTGAGQSPPGTRLGLQITRARLERHFGAAYRFQLEFPREGGAIARVRIPFQTGSPAPDPRVGRDGGEPLHA
ncbi:MAG: histidine kinase [Holophagaceae bacterium]